MYQPITACTIDHSLRNFFHPADMNDCRFARVFDNLSPEAEDAIIEIFKENPCLYDIADSRSKNRERRDRILSEKAKELKEGGISLHSLVSSWCIWVCFKHVSKLFQASEKQNFAPGKQADCLRNCFPQTCLKHVSDTV